MFLSSIPNTITPGETFTFSLHVRHHPTSQLLTTVLIEVIGIEHTMADNWSTSTPSSRMFSCLNTVCSVDKTISTEEEEIPLSIQIPTMIYDSSKLVYCTLPPTVGSSLQVGNPTKGVCVQYFLQVRAPIGTGLAQQEITILPNDTGFNIDRFVDISGNSLNRQYSTTTRLHEGLFGNINKGTVSLSGGIISGAQGEASFNLNFLYAPPLPFSVSFKIYQTHYSSPQGMGQILDGTKVTQMRRMKVQTEDVLGFIWEAKTGVLSFPYTLDNGCVPNFVSVTTAVSYLFEVCLKFSCGSVKLSVPLVLGEVSSAPPAYH